MLKIIRLLWLKVKVWFMFKVIRHYLRRGNSIDLITLAMTEFTEIDYGIARHIILKEKYRINEIRRDKRRLIKELYELHKTES